MKGFLRLILEGSRRGAESYARAVFDQHDVRYLYEEIIAPALREVGELWLSDRITIADEHLATATAQSAVAALYPSFPWPAERGPRVLIGCVQGERHDFGARMVADLLALDGWDELFIGADVPVDDFARKVREVEPRAAAVSVTLQRHLPMVRALVDAVRQARAGVKILVGGLAATDQRGLVESVGADAFANCGSEAVEVMRAWK